ncbi:ABC transporter substrate-binding protein [Stackebrandtia soli]|uniref:ABC transporter substrate-binding protein n=1 Tax=Stackebrandtia soli TaxID=1892856 RepID=UPI0039E90012
MAPTRRRFVALAAAVALTGALAACGGDEPTAEKPTEKGEYAAGDLVLDGKPEKIVSLSATATEMLFAIDAGPQVTAVDVQSTFPADAPVTDLDAFTPNAEAIAGYEPDLVIVGHDQDGIAGKLADVKIPVYFAPAAATLDDTYAQISDLGSLTGHTAEATELNEQISTSIDGMIEELPGEDNGTVYYELDSELYSLTSTTFAGSLLSAAGLENIADEADDAESSGGYPQLSAEHIFASDPDYIFVSGQPAVEELTSRDGWDSLTAVKEGNVIALDPDVASRWGPRVVELMQAITGAIK